MVKKNFLDVLSDTSCGVASIACQPPYPLARSGRAIHTSFQT